MANWFQRAAVALTAYRIAPEVGKFIEMAQRDLGAFREISESITDLQLDLEDQQYRLMVSRSRNEFSRVGLDLIIEASRLFFLKNPIIRRGCRISSFYVFGRGVQVSSEDRAANDVLQAFWNDPRNQVELSQTALLDSNNSLQTDGNLFFCLFADEVDGSVQVRTIDALQIREIIADPDDASVHWYYKRAWPAANFDITSGLVIQENKFAWYPALGYDPEVKPAQIGTWDVHWDSPIVHFKDGSPKKWLFGCPKVYPALDWASAYKQLLADYCKKAQNLARFGLKATTKGGDKSVAALKNKLQSTYAVGDQFAERNPAPQTGSAFISGEGIKLDALRIAGANSDPEEGRRVAHMIYNVFDLPETFFGDVSVGTLATATSLDRPTELAFKSQQEAWKAIIESVCRFVLFKAKRAPGSEAGKQMREAKTDTQAVSVKVTFPAIVEQDVDKAVGAIVKAFTGGNLNATPCGLLDPKTAAGMAASALGIDDVKSMVDAMYGADYDPSDFGVSAPAEAPPAGAPVPAGGGPSQQQPRRSSQSPQAA